METPQIIKDYVAAWTAADLNGWLATFAVDGTYRDPDVPQPATAHELKEHFAGFFGGFPNATCETVGLDAIAGDVWVWRFVIHGTNTGIFKELAPTGLKVTVPGCQFIEIYGDRIHHVEGYVDRLTLLTQLGLAGSSLPIMLSAREAK